MLCRRRFVVALSLVMGVGVGASLLSRTTSVHAQVQSGDYWLYQPHQPAPVGRAWCNSDRTVEYWAYVNGEYEFGGASSGLSGRWRLEVEQVGSASYASFADFKDAVLDQPEIQGKTILFQNHQVSESVEVN